MADIPLNHLSRPQLVHLLLRIVDLLSLPSMPAPSVPLSGHQRGCPNVVPYDASLDPWNAPDEGQRDSFVTRDPGALGSSGSGNNGYGSILQRLHFTQWCRVRRPVTLHQAALAIPGTYHVSGLIAKGLNPALPVFALEGQPSQA